MPKRLNKSKRNNKHKTGRKTRRRVLKAGNGEKVKCSMCEKTVNKIDTLVPNKCLIEHGKGAHRICQKCWWNKKKGFARESVSHKCPGCKKGLPLTPFEKHPDVYIDLT